MSQAKVRSALVTAYKNGGFFTDANTQWGNSTFVPPVKTPWARVSYMPSRPFVATLGTSGEDEVVGFLQIDLNYPIDSGEGAVLQKADSLRTLFKAGSRFSYSGQEVVVSGCGISPGQHIESYYRVVVSVYFYARINR